MRLNNRIAALEGKVPSKSQYDMIVIRGVTPSPDGPVPKPASLVFLICEGGGSLSREEGETEDAFIARAQAIVDERRQGGGEHA